MKVQVKVLETHKIQDGTIKGTIEFPKGTMRRDSVSFEDAVEVWLSDEQEIKGGEPVADTDREKFLFDCGLAYDIARVGIFNKIKDQQHKDLLDGVKEE